VENAELQITVVTPSGSLELSIGNEPLWIGRNPECAVFLPSNVVSRRHVSLSRQGVDLVVADCSHNGSLVDGLLLRQAARVVRAQTVPIRVGPFELQVIRKTQPPVPVVAPIPLAVPVAAPIPVLLATPVVAPVVVQLASPPVETEAPPLLRRRIHRSLLDHLDLPKLGRARINVDEMRPKVIEALGMILQSMGAELPENLDRQRLVQELTDEALGLGPLEQLLQDIEVSEIMVVDPQSIYAERAGRLTLTGLRFTDDETVRAVIERIVTPLGRRIDESTPIVDARLKDGSRVNAVIPPLALKGACITIRKFRKEPLQMSELVKFGSLSQRMASFLERSVKVKKNIIISGGTGSGKTTLLNVLSGSISGDERLVTIEDAAELQLRQPHVVSLESRPPNMEGKGEYTIRDLLKNALRMRPDRIIVGECRGGETLDMLQAMNTGHEGSMTTTHANSPREAVARIETLCLMSGVELPIQAIRRQIASSVHVIVQQSRLSDGSRRVTNITELVGLGHDGEIEMREIFSFCRTGTAENGRIVGEHRASGYMPSFVDQFIAHGVVSQGDYV